MSLKLIGIATLILASLLFAVYAVKPFRRLLFPNPTFHSFVASLVATFVGVYLAATVAQHDRMADSKTRTLRLLESTRCQVESEAIAAHLTRRRILDPRLNPPDASPISENLIRSQSIARLAEAMLRSELVLQHFEPGPAFRASANISGALLSAETATKEEAAHAIAEHVARLRNHFVNASDILTVQVGLLSDRVTRQCANVLFNALYRAYVEDALTIDEAIDQAKQINRECAAFAEETLFLEFLEEGRLKKRCS